MATVQRTDIQECKYLFGLEQLMARDNPFDYLAENTIGCHYRLTFKFSRESEELI